MTAVCNSSVLLALGSVGLLVLLQEKYPEGIVIPDAVWREVVEEGGTRPGAREVAAAPWIASRAPRDQRMVRLLRRELDAGEAEAIALAHEIGASVGLLDETDARRWRSVWDYESLALWGSWCGRRGLVRFRVSSRSGRLLTDRHAFG